jgi:light-regulated signal transduction histidine kinase (bacteriophytochrome)
MGYLGGFVVNGQLFSVVVHRLDFRALVEFELLDRLVSPEEMNQEIAHFVGRLGITTCEADLYRLMVEQIARLTGYDRVLLYSFDEIGHGTVLEEENNGVLPSYLDLRFPASDIPPQARELYVANTMRAIPNASYAASALVGLPSVAAAKLDLSQSILRSVSPVHLEYMRNMGTAASASFSILSDGKLWGLVGAHNATAKRIPFLIRSVCDLLTRMAAAQLKALRTASELKSKVKFQSVHRRILTQMAAKNDYMAAMEAEVADLKNLTNADGVALLVGGRLGISGRTPSEEQLIELVEWLDQLPELEIFKTNHLGSQIEWAKEIRSTASGMLAMRISDVKRGFLLWFRPEVISTVKWAGEPVKLRDQAQQLHPRNSFATWQETVTGKSIPWTDMEVESASEFRAAVIKIFLKRAEEAAHLSEARFDLLTHSIPTLVWTADDGGELTYVNEHWINNGLPSAGRWFEVSLSSVEDKFSCAERWASAVAEGTAFEEELQLNLGAAEGPRWHLVRAVPYLKADRKRAGWLGTCTDLTERRLREHAERTTEKLAITGRMTSVIAHEINNPLESLTNIVYLLKGIYPENEVANEYFAMADTELERISGITKQTLRWSRENINHREWTSAGYLFDDAVRLFAGKLRNRAVTVSMPPGDIPVYGAVGQLRQVLTNLLSNALDAVPVGGSIRFESAASETQATLKVVDAGVGMSSELQRKVFDPYFSTKGDLGNGLGLYISREVIESHGGTLTVSSEVGRGSTFVVTLPLPKVERPSAQLN